MALTPVQAVWKNQLRFITFLRFGIGKASLVTAPSREERAVFQETGKEKKWKKRQEENKDAPLFCWKGQFFLLRAKTHFCLAFK